MENFPVTPWWNNPPVASEEKNTRNLEERDIEIWAALGNICADPLHACFPWSKDRLPRSNSQPSTSAPLERKHPPKIAARYAKCALES